MRASSQRNSAQTATAWNSMCSPYGRRPGRPGRCWALHKPVAGEIGLRNERQKELGHRGYAVVRDAVARKLVFKGTRAARIGTDGQRIEDSDGRGGIIAA